jgi:hypothetical protein
MGNSTERESISLLLTENEKVSGTTGNAFSGLIKVLQLSCLDLVSTPNSRRF